MADTKPKVVVVGYTYPSNFEGVMGLTSALELAKTGKYEVAVLAKHMPGDYDTIGYASPWAGANYLPTGVQGSDHAQYERDTWPSLEKLAREVPEAGIHFQDTYEYWNNDEASDTAVGNWFQALTASEGPWFAEIMPDYRKLSAAEAKPFDSGIGFTSVCLNVSIYLPWLASQCLKHGVKIRRAVFAHLLDAKHAHPSGKPADLIINATGLSSMKLPGVADPKVHPARAQVVIVRNEPRVMISSTSVDDAPNGDELVYIMQRAAGGGTILGGCYQKDNWSSDVDHGLAHRIMKRAVDICPALTDESSMPRGKEWKANSGVESLSVIRHAVGMRPIRDGGPRVDIERMKGRDAEEGDTCVIHNYGHGGYGYQASYGCAYRVVKLAEEALAG